MGSTTKALPMSSLGLPLCVALWFCIRVFRGGGADQHQASRIEAERLCKELAGLLGNEELRLKR